MAKFLYPFICPWTSRLLPCPTCCKKCCSKQWGTCISFSCVFLRVCARSGFIRSYGSSIPSFLKYLHTVFHNGYVNLHSSQQCKRVPLSSTSSPAFIVCRYFNDDHSDGVRWYLIVVLICISLGVSGVEHLFMSLLAICMSSLEKCLFRSSAHFWLNHLFSAVELLVYFGD